MFIRALAILAVLAGLTLGVSYYLGAEILAALGLIVSQIKIVAGKIAALSSRTVLVWLKAQGLNFARVELGKRWIVKVLIPMLIGASLQRRISLLVADFVAGFKLRVQRLNAVYQTWPMPVKITAMLAVLCAVLLLALSSMSLWLLIFSVQLPIWIMASVGSLGGILSRSLQKLLFRTVMFMQLHRLWGAVKRRLPQSYLDRKRRFDYKVARIVVRRRKMTVAQLHAQKDGWAMRWALIREYFRHARPAQPTKAEMDVMRARRAAEKDAGEAATRPSRQSQRTDPTIQSPSAQPPDTSRNYSTPVPPRRSETAPPRSADGPSLPSGNSAHPGQ